MIFYPEQTQRFYTLLTSLTNYANRELKVCKSPVDARTGNMDPNLQMAVLNALWTKLSLIDSFVEENPDNLPEELIKEALGWKSGINDSFVAMEEAAVGTLFLYMDTVYAVRGLSREIRSIISRFPVVVKTILVPFEGSITFTGNLMENPANLGNMPQDVVQEWREKTKGSNIVSTADQFKIASRASHALKEQREAEEYVRRKAREERIAKEGADSLEKGMYRGGLADVSAEDRAKALSDEIKRRVGQAEASDFINAYVEANARQEAPFATCCEGALAIGVAEKEAQVASKELQHSLEFSSEDEFKSFRLAFEAGGVRKLDLNELTLESLTGLQPLEPYLFMHNHEGEVCMAIPADLMEIASGFDWDEVSKHRATAERAVLDCEAIVEMCGIVSTADAFEQVKEWHPEVAEELGDVDAFATLILESARLLYAELGSWRQGDVTYLIHETLANSLYGATAEELAEGKKKPQISKRTEDYFRFLITRHNQLGRQSLPAEVVKQDALAWKKSLPQVQALTSWLDAHVPEETDDFTFGDQATEGVIQLCNNGYQGKPLTTTFIERFKLKLNSDQTEVLGERLNAACIVLPNWGNNGISPGKLAASQGMSVLSDQSQTKKVGRNDPCPCGSGKKYKKCCGM